MAKNKEIKKIEKEVLVETTIISEEVEVPKEISKKVDLFIKQITNPKISTLAIDGIAEEEIKGVVNLSKMLNTPLANLSSDNSEGNKISTTIVNLKGQIEEINPAKVNLDSGFFGRLLESITGKTAISKYFKKFETYSQAINGIIETLEEGGASLQEENAIFLQDKTKLIEFTKRMKEKLEILNHTSFKLNNIIEQEKDEDQKRFLIQDVDYTLQQQTMDLQQMVLTSAQGVMALDVLIKNNRELITSIKRIKNVVMVALNIGVMVSIGLANQKRVLDTTKSITNATNEIITANAEMLQTQGLEIHKQASSNILDMTKLKAAFESTLKTIEEAETFRINSLPEMKKSASDIQILLNQFNGKVDLMEKQSNLYLEN